VLVNDDDRSPRALILTHCTGQRVKRSVTTCHRPIPLSPRVPMTSPRSLQLPRYSSRPTCMLTLVHDSRVSTLTTNYSVL
jgi:hypothetical protein